MCEAGRQTLYNSFLFNPHHCGASINSDYSNEIKLSGFHSPMTLKKNVTHNGTSAVATARFLGPERVLALFCVCMCV